MPIVSVNTVSLIGTLRNAPVLVPEQETIYFTVMLTDPEHRIDAIPCRAPWELCGALSGAKAGERVMVCGKLRTKNTNGAYHQLHVWVTDLTPLFS